MTAVYGDSPVYVSMNLYITMVGLSSVQNAPLKVVFVIHFVLTAWGIQGEWCPKSYLFYNSMFLAILLWGIYQKDSEEPMQLAVVLSACCMFLDVVLLSIYFPNTTYSSERFSVGMAILNLVIRPVTFLVFYRTYADRAEAVGTGISNLFGRGHRSQPYEDIDSLVHQRVPHDEASRPGHSPGAPDTKMPPPYHN
ncbi:type-1 angiotensin II receptor-associated protein [Bacillus rossius redtenbacheri]|uniref:type-1 angiotensin II receptor-associated protein n=1 Tax=Bacillus rossius redtenbacheri TaxID=93214 RepID=UPI002FDDDDBE